MYEEDRDTLRLLEKTDRQVSATSSTFNNEESANEALRPGFANGKPVQVTTTATQSCLRPFRSPHTQIKRKLAKAGFYGWRMGVLCGSCISAVILCFNIGVVIYAAVKGKGFQNGFAAPFSINSSNLAQLNIGIHLVINILSTLLLSASNYTMQVLSSPTRKEIDSVHQKGQWFDIGVLSVRNLKRIAPKRQLLCAVMILTSVPLHLLSVLQTHFMKYCF